jgi:hypothetical protein
MLLPRRRMFMTMADGKEIPTLKITYKRRK